MIPPTNGDAGPASHFQNGNFMCGVVEGFYGRPWTSDQRRKLFQRMKQMGMNMYLYAPKDDCKHRICWRDMYSVEEADHLTGLIEAAEENSVTFVYALSPGVDIAFSNSREVTQLKRKLEQVSSFGCKAFALLFDDIDTDMCEADKEIFQSFAHAQVSVTNEVYQHLGQPSFLFCPTEYCASRAVPNVPASEYLGTIGTKLLPGIDVMWTGGKVISKKITIKSIEEISSVLKRPPVIWDNIHANDYDQKRVFLGPFDGRSPELIPYLRGVLTNPNCEFEANFVAMHTLAQWSRSNVDGIKKDVVLSDSPVTADIRLETESEYSSDEELPNHLNQNYKPRQALNTAIADWMEVFADDCSAVPKKLVPSLPPADVIPGPPISCATEIPPIGQAQSQPIPVPGAVNHINELNQLEVNESYMQPSMSLKPMNSLLSDSSSTESDSESGIESLEPMDCAITPGTTPASSDISNSPPVLDLKEETVESKPVSSIDLMQVDNLDSNTVTPLTNIPSRPELSTHNSLITVSKNTSSIPTMTSEDVKLLVDLFYLPFQHGNEAVEILTDCVWLKYNYHCLCVSKHCNLSPEQLKNIEEWHFREQKLQEKMSAVFTMMDRFCAVPNKAMVYDLFPYLWDMKGALSILRSFIRWLAMGQLPESCLGYLPGSPYTWSNKMYCEAFQSGDQEPWVFRGGLQAEFQRLALLDCASDLFMLMVPQTPEPFMCPVRPYTPADEGAVFNVCKELYSGFQENCDFCAYQDLVPDLLLGGFTTTSPTHCFILEDEEGICGYVVSAVDAKDYYKKLEIAYLPAMREKYSLVEHQEEPSPAKDAIDSFYEFKPVLPECVYTHHPSLVRIGLSPRCKDPSASRRLLAVAFAALKASGSRGVHIPLHISEDTPAGKEFYAKHSFFNIHVADEPTNNTVLLGRVI